MEKPRAEIDGKEIEVELVEDEPAQNAWSYKRPGTWRLFFPVVIVALVIILITALSATLFIWALPVLLPILVVWFIIRLLK